MKIIEALKICREIPQCAYCQDYDHTRFNHHSKTRCVKCGEYNSQSLLVIIQNF